LVSPPQLAEDGNGVPLGLERGLGHVAEVLTVDLQRRRLDARCDQPTPLQVDGEDLGDVTGAAFEAERDAVTVLC